MKLVQLMAVEHLLYALDSEGQVWRFRPVLNQSSGFWERVSMTTEDNYELPGDEPLGQTKPPQEGA